MTHAEQEPIKPDAGRDEYETWRDLQEVLEQRDREYWAEENDGDG